MILQDNGDIVSESKSDYKGMPELEEASDGGRVEYAVGKLLVTSELLTLKSRRMTWSSKEKIFSIHGTTSIIRYVA